MRLLVTCHRDPYVHTGGTEQVIRSLGSGLAARGHRVTIVTAKEPIAPYQSIHDGVESLAAFEPNGSLLTTDRNLSDFLGHFGWDAIILYGQGVWCTDSIWRDVGQHWKRYLSHAKVLYFPVGFPFFGDLKHFLYYHIVQDHLIENSDTVAALTEAEAAQILKLGRPKRLEHIPNGIDFPFWQAATPPHFIRQRFHLPDGPLILNVGGDYGNKQLADACLGVEELNSLLRDKVTLVLIGPGTEIWEGEFARGLGIISEADKVALFHEARLLLHTSSFEGFGLVLLEALAAGIPFVSTEVGAAVELSRQFGGQLIRNRDPVTIAYHLMQELDTERDPLELKAIAQKYDWANIIPKVEDALI